MRLNILQQTPTLLRVNLKPKGFLYWLFGSIFIAGGVFLVTSLGRATTLTCNRSTPTQGRCQLVIKGFLKSQVKNWDIQELQGAKLDTKTIDAWGSYPLVLLTKSGSFPIDLINADSTKKKRLAVQITTIIQESQVSQSTIHEDSRLWTYPLGIFLILGGSVCMIYITINRTIICILDKKLNKLTIERQGLFSKDIVEAKLSEIVGLDINAFTVDSSSSYNIIFRLDSENDIYLASGPMFTAKSADRTFEAIANFLNLENTNLFTHT
ncbi:hypothetical protein BV378_07440 [Nostoc sp. RF31YmG]|nr:hypothetical protein BV378_07440 [Nostoc sp. RF31YmG]